MELSILNINPEIRPCSTHGIWCELAQAEFVGFIITFRSTRLPDLTLINTALPSLFAFACSRQLSTSGLVDAEI